MHEERTARETQGVVGGQRGPSCDAVAHARTPSGACLERSNTTRCLMNPILEWRAVPGSEHVLPGMAPSVQRPVDNLKHGLQATASAQKSRMRSSVYSRQQKRPSNGTRNSWASRWTSAPTAWCLARTWTLCWCAAHLRPSHQDVTAADRLHSSFHPQARRCSKFAALRAPARRRNTAAASLTSALSARQQW